MKDRTCVKCGNGSLNGLPLCDTCKESLKDFKALAEYLNDFKGNKEDLIYILVSEISTRQTSIINSCKVVPNYSEGTIELVPKEPSNTTIHEKPWLWEKYLNIKRIIEEIKQLRIAQSRAEQYYGGE